MPDYDDDKYVDLSPQLQENDEYVDLSPQLKASDEYVNLSPFKKEGGASRPASDANQYQNLSPAREESKYQVLHVPREDEPYQVLHVPREDEPYQVFDMKTNKMIELNKAQPDQMIELNKMREKYGVGEKAAEFAVNFQNAFFSALNRGQFFQNENPESPEENKPVFIMNVSSPPPQLNIQDHLYSSFNNIINHDIDRLGKSINYLLNISNAPGHQLNFDGTQKQCNANNLAHPPWYLGFWRDTYIEIEGVKLNPNKNAVLKFKFSDLDEPRPEINYVVTAEGENNHRIQIADYFSIGGDEPFRGSGILKNLIGGRLEGDNISDPTGWLLVWNADTWKCQLARETINYHDYDFDGDYGWEDHDYNYICQNLFDYITLSIGRGNEFEISSIKIVLNGVNILKKSYPETQPFTRPVITPYQRLVLDNLIQSYKHNSLVHNHGAYSDNLNIGYNRSRILQNDIQIQVSKELGQSWSPKYAPEARWEKDQGGNWATAPANWCADFSGWVIEKTHQNYSTDEVPFETIEFPDFFKRNSTWICPSNTSYSDIGNIVQPGFLANVRHGGHCVNFLYWIDPGFYNGFSWNGMCLLDIYEQPKWNITYADKIIRFVNDGIYKLNYSGVFGNSSNLDPPPGRFIPEAPVNWFLVTNGNSGGGRVKKSVVPIVNLKSRDIDKMDYETLTELFKTAGGMHGVLWSRVGNWATVQYSHGTAPENELDFYRINYEDGFGDTNGL